jgi:cytochrome c553
MTNDAGGIVGPLIRVVVKHPWLTGGAVAIIGAVVAVLVILSGVVPIRASSGHWTITAKILDFAKVRSVATHSLGVHAPPLDDPALVLRGAGHYESGCYPCHGRPGTGIPPVMAAMTPVPPELSGRMNRWTSEELFSIVKHGIKFTGMPAWPVQQRDDEVWAMVAFLRRMPALDAAAYRRLVYGDGSAPDGLSRTEADERQVPRAVRDICSRCHGVDGTGRGPGAFPSLAGQRSAYLHASLRAFAGRQRFSGIMSTIAATIDDGTLREAAEYYARLPARSAGPAEDAQAAKRGEAIAALGIPDRDIPSCADCHGPIQRPRTLAPIQLRRNPAYPMLSGQYAPYLALQLELFKGRRRGGSPYANLMHVFVDRLRPEQIRDVTLYYSSLQAPPTDAPVVPAAQ